MEIDQMLESYDPQGGLFLCTTIHVMSPSIPAFPRRTEQEHQRLGAKYEQTRSYTAAREEVVNQHAARLTQLSCLPCPFLHTPHSHM